MILKFAIILAFKAAVTLSFFVAVEGLRHIIKRLLPNSMKPTYNANNWVSLI